MIIKSPFRPSENPHFQPAFGDAGGLSNHVFSLQILYPHNIRIIGNISWGNHWKKWRYPHMFDDVYIYICMYTYIDIYIYYYIHYNVYIYFIMPPLIVASIQHMFDWKSQICREALPVQDQCSRHPNSAGSLAAWWSTVVNLELRHTWNVYSVMVVSINGGTRVPQ
jgi:hypothetical protein